jgi:NDP-sugar pyrophosphorylase family protein
VTGVPDALGPAKPTGARAHRGLVQRFHERRVPRRLARAFVLATVPPPPEAWGHFGQSFVVPPARVSRPDLVEIGDGVVILENVWMSVEHFFEDIRPRFVLGDRVRVGRGCQFTVVGEVVVEEDALIGDFVQIGDTSHLFEARLRPGRDRHEFAPGPSSAVMSSCCRASPSAPARSSTTTASSTPTCRPVRSCVATRRNR